MKRMYRYRIYTENINAHGVRDIVGKYFDGFTMFTGLGVYKSEHEANLTIEIITEHHIKNQVDIESICREINQANRQECCLVTVEKVETFFVTGKKQLSSVEIAKRVKAVADTKGILPDMSID